MENLKIKCKTAEQDKQAQELFLSLGYELFNSKRVGMISTEGWTAYPDVLDNWEAYDAKEITIQELRDMVNHMKEYLEPSNNYSLIKAHRKEGNDWIEVPEGANFYCDRYFWMQLNSEKFWNGDNWQNDFKTLCGFSKSFNKTILWQRHTQPEELPFMDSLPEFKHDFGASSLNDQYAEIEQVRQQTIEATLAERQAQYGCFEDVARTTGKIMEALSEVRVNGLNDLPYPHRMALYMIASKMARIVNGDFNHKDGWHDIGGYSKLIEDLL